MGEGSVRTFLAVLRRIVIAFFITVGVGIIFLILAEPIYRFTDADAEIPRQLFLQMGNLLGLIVGVVYLLLPLFRRKPKEALPK